MQRVIKKTFKIIAYTVLTIVAFLVALVYTDRNSLSRLERGNFSKSVTPIAHADAPIYSGEGGGGEGGEGGGGEGEGGEGGEGCGGGEGG